MMKCLLYYGFAVAFVVGVPSASIAEDSVRSTQIQIGDLNLASDSGKAAFSDRVNYGADMVCQKPDDSHRLTARRQFQDCREIALGSVKPQMERAIAAAQSKSSVLSMQGDH